MATVHAGIKRSYQQMRDLSHSSLLQKQPSAPASREQSPSAKDGGQSRSGFITPSRDWHVHPRVASFPPDASVVLLGLRGVGKSSLGVLAATAYNRTLVESDKAFVDATSQTAAAYRKLHGTSDYVKRHHQVLRRLLETCSKNCIIVCGFSDLEHQGASILAEFAQSHPVIHISRDADGIQSYLQVWALDKIRSLLQTSGPILRSCSNFEFFNLSESLQGNAAAKQTDRTSTLAGPFLTLKRVERDFLKLLRNVLGDHEREQSHHSAYPLSRFEVHERSFTLAGTISVDQVLQPGIDLDALQVGVDAIDLRVEPTSVMTADLQGRISQAFAVLRRSTILPLLITTVSREEGHGARPDQRQLAELISYCLRLGPEYCTVDLAIDDTRAAILIAEKGLTKIIATRDFSERPPHGWNDVACAKSFERASQLGCELCRITMPARFMRDNFEAQAFRIKMKSTASLPGLICFNTGRLGKPSICLNNMFTPVNLPLTGGDQDQDRSFALLTSKDMFQSLFASFIYEPMKFFIYGANVGYSLSPAMHNAAYSECGMPHVFSTHSSPTLENFRSLSAEHDFGGAAVVQPYKTGVLPLLKGLSSHAQAIGSVNTIIPIRELAEDGALPNELGIISQLNRRGPVLALYGHNTDWIGIRACLRRGLSPANTIRQQSTALVCGAGGQARSAIYAMLSLGIRNIFVCNRTPAHAHALAEHYNDLIKRHAISELDPLQADTTQIHVLETFDAAWPSAFRHPTLIVSSVPTQSNDGSPIDFDLRDNWLKSPTGGVVLELAYRPMITPIVRKMRAQAHRGWILMDGFDVLPEQAFAQFELFTGRRAPRKLMRERVIEHHRAQQQEAQNGENLDPNPSR